MSLYSLSILVFSYLYFFFVFMCVSSQRARALAASGPVFSAYNPPSILRSSLRPTPVGTPSASPGRSITPPLRSKESRITFIEEEASPEPEKGIRWTNGVRQSTVCRLQLVGLVVLSVAPPVHMLGKTLNPK